VGKPGFPTPSSAGGPGPHAGVWGNPVSPDPHPVGGRSPSRQNLSWSQGVGKPGFPTPPPGGGAALPGRTFPGAGVWGNPVSPHPRPREGLALTQGSGETRFPQTPTRWGRSPPRQNLSWSRGVGKPGFPHTPARGRAWEGFALPGTTVGRPRSRVRGKRSHSLATIVGRGMKPRSFNLSRISSMDFCPRLRTESRAFSSICSTCPTRVISARFRQL